MDTLSRPTHIVPRYAEQDFTEVKEVDSGGEATFYRGYHPHFGRKPLGIKILNNVFATAQEAHTLAKCPPHRNIVRIYGHYILSNSPKYAGYVMEYFEFGNFHNFLHNQNNSYTKIEIWEWIRQITKGLQHLHQHHIIHRDVKSKNILMVNRNHVKLADFGTARVMSSGVETPLVMTSSVGTPAYRAPEVFGIADYSYPVDIYSVGIIIWEITHHLEPSTQTQRPLPINAENVDPDLHDLIERCWHSAPLVRPTAGAIAAESTKRIMNIIRSVHQLHVMELLSTQQGEKNGNCSQLIESGKIGKCWHTNQSKMLVTEDFIKEDQRKIENKSVDQKGSTEQLAEIHHPPKDNKSVAELELRRLLADTRRFSVTQKERPPHFPTYNTEKKDFTKVYRLTLTCPEDDKKFKEALESKPIDAEVERGTLRVITTVRNVWEPMPRFWRKYLMCMVLYVQLYMIFLTASFLSFEACPHQKHSTACNMAIIIFCIVFVLTICNWIVYMCFYYGNKRMRLSIASVHVINFILSCIIAIIVFTGIRVQWQAVIMLIISFFDIISYTCWGIDLVFSEIETK